MACEYVDSSIMGHQAFTYIIEKRRISLMKNVVIHSEQTSSMFFLVDFFLQQFNSGKLLEVQQFPWILKQNQSAILEIYGSAWP